MENNLQEIIRAARIKAGWTEAEIAANKKAMVGRLTDDQQEHFDAMKKVGFMNVEQMERD